MKIDIGDMFQAITWTVLVIRAAASALTRSVARALRNDSASRLT